MRQHLTARNGWWTTGILIALFEWNCLPGETLSEGADKWIEKHPYRTRILILLLAAHVSNMIPNRLDPVHQIALLIKR